MIMLSFTTSSATCINTQLLCRNAAAAVRQGAVRNHMSHGGDPLVSSPPPIKSGPRQPLQLGLESAKATQNVLRVLESSLGVYGYQCADTIRNVWHDCGLLWERRRDDGRGGNGGADTGSGSSWVAKTMQQQVDDLKESPPRATSQKLTPPQLLSLNFTDERTALAKVVGPDGFTRFVSMLRLDPSPKELRERRSMMSGPAMANDGWHIVREVVGGAACTQSSTDGAASDVYASVSDVLTQYLSVEHGGGSTDRKKAEDIFMPQASLLAVGTSPPEEPPTDWSSPAGTLLEISQSAYIQGVETQQPHSEPSKLHDSIVQIDVLPCKTAAAATVHVGNGAQTTVFVDHLLLGRSDTTNKVDWRILSKVFTSRRWPRPRD